LAETDTCGARPAIAHFEAVELPIEHRDVTTIMALLGDIQHDVARMRRLLEEANGEEEEAPENDR